MISLWGAILLAFGFTIWSVFCILVGASVVMGSYKKAQLPPTTPNLKMN